MPRSLSKRRDVDATLKLTTNAPVTLVRRHSGAVRTLPTTVTGVSNMSTLLTIGPAGAGRRNRAVRAGRTRVPVPKSVDSEGACGQRDGVGGGRGTVQTWIPTSSATPTGAVPSTW